MGKRVKIKDIAETCGFSNTLVSMVLNNKASLHGIKPDTQEKVLYIARQMGYFEETPGVKENNVIHVPGIVGIVVPDLHNQFLFEIAPCLNKAFTAIGLTFGIVTRNENEQRFIAIINELKEMYSGLILLGDAADDIIIRKLKETYFPFIVLEKKISRYRINEVNSDSEEACRLVGSHIFKLGYSNISVIEKKGCMNCLTETDVLINTIQKLVPGIKITRHALDYNLIQHDTDMEEVVKALRPPESSQLFIVKHAEMVYHIISYLRRKKFRIPNDIAVISMDNGIGFSLMDPPVTRINRNYTALALKASQMLWSEIKNNGRGKYKRSVKIKPELIIEKSCGSVL
ncbi:MAG TPA: hypothetical protein DEQ09_06190 [Bacteroidales bacterium]|nr:hypothetical protein [Bacteroidales bacterium]